ncbi:MAG TPA: ABC transporter permease [Gaiellaceae bacterium]|nr:ABC transporter permease [Gaiellaceae bacterium]
MIRYLIRRIIWAFALFIVVTLISFVLFFLIPADPAKEACGKACTAPQVARVAHYLGTDRPVYTQYGKFLGRLAPISFSGGFHLKSPNLGRSFVNRRDVNTVVGQAAPETASLVFGGMVLWMLFAIPIGILSALRPRSLLDRASMTGVLIGVSAHPVWIGLILIYVFAYTFHLFPLGGYANFFGGSLTQAGGPIEWAKHLVLPWMTFAFLYTAIYVRMIRSNVMETINEDYVRTARAKGAPESRVMRSHILRNALLPIVTMLGMDVAAALGGAIFTETVFGLNGLGYTSIQSLQQYDSPTVMGIIVFATTAIIVMNLLVDLLYAWVDPRIRLT